jgi:ABC-type dipeptide/oligopeptide/nickel transport system ATPase component
MAVFDCGLIFLLFESGLAGKCGKSEVGTIIMSLSPKSKVTLEEYLQFHKFQKKLELRSRSRSRGKEMPFSVEQEQSMHSMFSLMDSWSFDIKMELHQFMNAPQPKEKVLFHLSSLLDRFTLKIKE